MALLAEYGLIPDVFDTTCYSTADLADAHLQHLKEILLCEGVVRNFRDGAWLKEFEGETRPWHKRGRELLKKLVTQNRLQLDRPHLATAPTTDIEWCDEAIASHRTRALGGIISTQSTSEQFSKEPLVAPITKLSSAAWWANRSPSVRLGRNLSDYKRHLEPVLGCANSIMLIDAHCDPSIQRYADISPLICYVAGRNPQPVIEIHRVCYVGSGARREIVTPGTWEDRFNQAMGPQLAAAGLRVEVFIWDEFHDRYVISDLVGIALLNGLDTTTAPDARTTWSRLGRVDRDDIQREFDPAAKRHQLRHRFTI